MGEQGWPEVELHRYPATRDTPPSWPTDDPTYTSRQETETYVPEAALSQAREERDKAIRERDMAYGQKDLDPFIGDDGEPYSPATPREQMFLSVAFTARKRVEQARERALDEVRERLLSEEAIHAAAGVDYSPDWPETFDQLPDEEQRTWRQGVHRIITAALDSLSENEPQDQDRGGL